MAKIKIAGSNDNEDLVAEYLKEDPSNLPGSVLKETADIFGVSLEEVKNVVRGMSNARKEIAKQDDVTVN